MVIREEFDAAISRIQGFVDDRVLWDKIKAERVSPNALPPEVEDSDDEFDPQIHAYPPTAHQTLGSPEGRLVRMNQLDVTSNPAFHNFSKRLCSFLAEKFPGQKVNAWQQVSLKFGDANPKLVLLTD